MPSQPVNNPPNPWAGAHVEWIDAPPPAHLKVFEEHSRSILSANTSPDIPFTFSVNPYRGCFHGCAYCYARPTHQYLDFGAGSDFERKIVVKRNAAELLEASFMKPSWAGETVVFSGNTDCYQPLEASYELTRECLKVCRAFRNPVGIITKAALIQRDIDVLRELNHVAAVRVHVSIPFIDKTMSRRIEPGAPSPSVRLRTIRALADAGLEVGVSVSPVIPGLNDEQIVDILEAAAEAGATSAFRILLRLPAEVLPVFTERLADAYPDREQKVFNALRDTKSGALNRSAFGARMSGVGARWDAIERLFDLTCTRLHLNRRRDSDMTMPETGGTTTFVRPGSQLSLGL